MARQLVQRTVVILLCVLISFVAIFLVSDPDSLSDTGVHALLVGVTNGVAFSLIGANPTITGRLRTLIVCVVASLPLSAVVAVAVAHWQATHSGVPPDFHEKAEFALRWYWMPRLLLAGGASGVAVGLLATRLRRRA